MSKVLIIDDERDICFLISEILKDENFNCESAQNSTEAVEKFYKISPDLIILDVWLGSASKLDGIELLSKFKELNPLIPIIIISGHGTVDMAVNAIKKGAYDFIEKPFNSDKLTITSKRAIESASLIKENTKLKSIVNQNTPLIGNSNFIKELQQNINKIAISNSRIFISGPLGTGKKLISNIIHNNSIYSNFLCAIIDIKNTGDKELENLFSDSDKDINENIVAKSNNTTLILENIDYLNINYQKKLLYFLENKNFFEKNNIKLNQKIISLSSKNIEEEISRGNFLQSLYDRLSVIKLEIPPIISRREDIVPICEYYLNHYNKNKKVNLLFSDNAKSKLELYDWPGNIAQIINYVEKTIILNQNIEDLEKYTIDNLPLDMSEFNEENLLQNNYELSLKDARYKFEKDYLLSQIKRFHGNMKKISEFTGMERTALYRKLKSLNIQAEKK